MAAIRRNHGLHFTARKRCELSRRAGHPIGREHILGSPALHSNVLSSGVQVASVAVNGTRAIARASPLVAEISQNSG
jgi:hypothetical protein